MKKNKMAFCKPKFLYSYPRRVTPKTRYMTKEWILECVSVYICVCCWLFFVVNYHFYPSPGRRMKEPVRRRSGTINKCDKREELRERELVLDEGARPCAITFMYIILGTSMEKDKCNIVLQLTTSHTCTITRLTKAAQDIPRLSRKTVVCCL